MLIAIEDFRSLTGKEFKKGDIVPNGDATSCGKYLKNVDSVDVRTSEPEENKVMTTKDLKTKN